MAKQKKSDMLARWIDLDRTLGSQQGLDVETFAKRHGVSTRTIYRDLEAFAELGQFTRYEPDTMQVEPEHARWAHWYEAGVPWLFVRNMTRQSP